MDEITDKKDIIASFSHQLPLVVKLDYQEQDFFAVALNPTKDYLLITPIISSDGLQIEIPEKERIEIALKIRGVLWSGFAVIVEVIRGDFEGIWLTYPHSLKKVQRRNFLRLGFNFPVTINIYENGEQIRKVAGYCHDLSGSGISVNLETRVFLEENQIAVLSAKYDTLAIDCKIQPIYSIKQSLLFRQGFCFLDIDQTFSDTIHKTIIKEQIRRKKEGYI